MNYVKPKTLKEIMETGLKAEGYDGLYSACVECGCWIGDLAPCGYFEDCLPARRDLIIRGIQKASTERKAVEKVPELSKRDARVYTLNARDTKARREYAEKLALMIARMDYRVHQADPWPREYKIGGRVIVIDKEDAPQFRVVKKGYDE